MTSGDQDFSRTAGLDGVALYQPLYPSDLLLWQAAETLLPTGTTPLFFEGITGSLFRSTTEPSLYADFDALHLPGLRAFGLEVKLEPLPDDTEELRALLERSDRERVALYQFHGEPFADSEEEVEPDRQTEAQLAAEDRRRTVVQAGIVLSATQDTVTWWDEKGEVHTDTLDAIRARFSRALLMRPAHRPLTRRARMLALMQRVMVFEAAFPDRFLTGAEPDRQCREDAAKFLAEAAGKQSDPISLRWRQAGESLAQGDVKTGRNRLYDAVLRTFNLPEPVFYALSTPATDPLDAMLIRELTYLARAGNRDLKVLAARRLCGENWLRSVRQTLRQLTFSSDPLIRAAATPRMNSGPLPVHR